MSQKEPLLPEIRRRAIAEHVRARGSSSVADLEQEFQVSSMTIRRDLRELDRQGLAKRTHGGAVAPGLAAHEDSFNQRLDIDVAAKERLAIDAASLVEPGETVFVDCSTSGYYAAREIISRGISVSIITNSVPIMQLVASTDANVELIGTGGWMRKLTLSLVGPAAVRGNSGPFRRQAVPERQGTHQRWLAHRPRSARVRGEACDARSGRGVDPAARARQARRRAART